jgi:hypothetical protein
MIGNNQQKPTGYSKGDFAGGLIRGLLACLIFVSKYRH